MAVYNGAVQRHQQSPTIRDVINLNKILKWVRRKKCVIVFRKLVPPLKILIIPVSAFKRLEGECMACKGHVLALAEQRPDTPGGGAHWLEAVSRRHKRVNRSTFAAEINGLADALEPGKVLAMQYTEVVRRACTANQFALDATAGDRALPVEAVVDAMSVFTTVTASDIKLPLEESLVAIVMAIREQFSIGHLKALWWANTDVMLADALT